MSGDTVRRAAVHGQVDWLKRLFASGANPCETDEVGLTPLHYAVMNGHEEAIMCCAINDRGTDPDGQRSWALQQQSSCGWTALHIAVAEGKNAVETVKLLLELGLDPDLRDENGHTALDLARMKFEDTGSAVAELVLKIMTLPPPTEKKMAGRREEVKAAHWVQEVRRGNMASIGDYVTPKEDRAPIIPRELKVSEKWHVPFAAENLQAVRGCYGLQALRNLEEACAEADANALRRYQLAHSRQLKAETMSQFDFRTEVRYQVEGRQETHTFRGPVL